MFSVDKIEGKLFDANDIGMIQYNAGGLIPQLDRTNTVPFSERVQAFTIQPNPREQVMVLLKMVKVGGGVGISSYSACTIRRDTSLMYNSPSIKGIGILIPIYSHYSQ